MSSPEAKGPFVPSEKVLAEVRKYEKEHGPLSEQERKGFLNALTDAEFDKKHLPGLERLHRAGEEARARAEHDNWVEERHLGEEGEARAKILHND